MGERYIDTVMKIAHILSPVLSLLLFTVSFKLLIDKSSITSFFAFSHPSVNPITKKDIIDIARYIVPKHNNEQLVPPPETLCSTLWNIPFHPLEQLVTPYGNKRHLSHLSPHLSPLNPR